ncbi:RICIN domain-containing protein [Natrialbaceae archaeon A-chndr2]
MSEYQPEAELSRRSVLRGMAAMGAVAALGSQTTGGDTGTGTLFPSGFDPETPVESHHPGAPRFISVDEPIVNPVWTLGADTRGLEADEPPAWALWDKGRDNLAPRLPDLRADPHDYDASDFTWTLVDWPEASDGPDVVSFATATGDDLGRYDEGQDTVAEFRADAPGDYILELEAPDGTHELTLHAFPRGDGGAAVYKGDPDNAPRLELEATYDDEAEEFRLETNAQPAPFADSSSDDLWGVFRADDRDALSSAAIEEADGGLRATIPADALEGESARVHAAVYDDGTAKKSSQDLVVLDPDGSVDLPNRPPEWMADGIMYQLFPRSWAGEREATTLETLISGDDDTGAPGLDYLEDMGVDAIWLTPTVPATSVERQLDGELSGGGPHGYDTADYTGVSEDLVPDGEDPLEVYRRFVNECHDRNIKVVFDIVINHAGRTNPLFEDTIGERADGPGPWDTVTEWDEDHRAFDWWDRAEVPRRNEDGELLEAEPRPTGFADLQVMPNLNFESLSLREYIMGVADFWSRPQSAGGMGVDGFRADIAYGVPKSVWKEIREIGRYNNEEFLMFDETIPRDASYTESEFDMHHDTAGFLNQAQQVAADDAHGGSLFDTIDERSQIGLPDHSLVVNALENHDEHRILNQAAVDLHDPNHDDIDDGTWAYYANRVRCCAAAAFVLPGVPQLYYGIERQISRYGEGRHLGEDDHRGYDDDGNINVAADVREGGRQRAFMNWDDGPDEYHTNFFENLSTLYDEVEALHPDAEFDGIPFEADDDAELLLCERRVSRREDIDGPSTVAAIVNFGDGDTEVEIDAKYEGYDLFKDEDVLLEDHGDTITVEVGDLIVLPADDEEDESLEGTYRILADHSGKALDVADVSTDDGANVHQWEYVGGDNQHWTLEAVGDNEYRIVADHSGKVLDVENASGEDGTNVHQWEDVGGDNQRWFVEPVDDADTLYTITAVHSGKVLDVEGVSSDDGANVHQWEYVGGDNQHWRLEER